MLSASEDESALNLEGLQGRDARKTGAKQFEKRRKKHSEIMKEYWKERKS